MRIVVSGGAGFIGSHLVDRLIEQGHKIIILDNFVTGCRENVAKHLESGAATLVEHDITKPIYLGDKIERIYHLASPASPIDYQKLPIPTMKVGSLGTHNMLGMAKLHGARLLLASTSEVYGDPEIHPQPESYRGSVNPIGLRACYDEGKRAAETLFMDYHRHNGVNVRVVRIFNTYGPRMLPNDGRVVSNFIVQALRNEPITVYGEGTQTRCFCYVDDQIDAWIRLMDSPDEFVGPVNLGNPHEITILELAETIIEMTGSRCPLVRKPLPFDDPQRRCPDISLAKKELAWEPRVSLREGLARTIECFESVLRRGTLPILSIPSASQRPADRAVPQERT